MGEFDPGALPPVQFAGEGVHTRPGDGRQCSYLAHDFCNKCGWLDPAKFAAWRPSAVAAFATGALFGLALGVIAALALLP